MGKGARIKAKKAEKAFLENGKNIVLQNPVQQHFAAFIAGNASTCQRNPPHEGICPSTNGRLDDPTCSMVVEEDSGKGQHLVLCGAGPSLADHAAEWCHQGDQVWGCNSAAMWLYNQGHKVTHAFTVDQTAHMVEEWHTTPDLEYLIASSVHPHLVELLTGRGCRTRFFHNYVGVQAPPVEIEGQTMAYEDWLYTTLYPPTVRVGSGLNSVNRAIDLALFCGFERITVLGADCAMKVNKPAPEGAPIGSPAYRAWLQNDVVMHADGGSPLASGASEITLDGVVDGKVYLSKPDMLVSATHLVRNVMRVHKHVTFIGDTYLNAIKDKDDAFLNRLPNMVNARGELLT